MLFSNFDCMKASDELIRRRQFVLAFYKLKITYATLLTRYSDHPTLGWSQVGWWYLPPPDVGAGGHVTGWVEASTKEPEVHSNFPTFRKHLCRLLPRRLTNNTQRDWKSSENNNAKLLLKWRPTQSKHNWKVFFPRFFSLLLRVRIACSSFSYIARHGFYLTSRLGKRGLASGSEPCRNLYSHDTNHHRIRRNRDFLRSISGRIWLDIAFWEKKSMLPWICSQITRTNFGGIHFDTFTCSFYFRKTEPNCVHMSQMTRVRRKCLLRMYFSTLFVDDFGRNGRELPTFPIGFVAYLWVKKKVKIFSWPHTFRHYGRKTYTSHLVYCYLETTPWMDRRLSVYGVLT